MNGLRGNEGLIAAAWAFGTHNLGFGEIGSILKFGLYVCWVYDISLDLFALRSGLGGIGGGAGLIDSGNDVVLCRYRV